MKKAAAAERRRFLRDLDQLAAAVAAPLGETERSSARTHDATRGNLTWRLRVEPEEPMFPSMLRLTWGVRVPGVLEQTWPPGSREASHVPASWYQDALWAEDVQQLRTGRGRIYKYRVGPRPSPLAALNPLRPDYTAPLSEMTAFLVGLVEEVLPPMMRDITSKPELAEWMAAHPHLCNRKHTPEALASQVRILRGS